MRTPTVTSTWRADAEEAADQLGQLLLDGADGHDPAVEKLLKRIFRSPAPRCLISARPGPGTVLIEMVVADQDLDPLYEGLAHQDRDPLDEDPMYENHAENRLQRLDELLQTGVDLASAPGAITRMSLRVATGYGYPDRWYTPGSDPIKLPKT